MAAWENSLPKEAWLPLTGEDISTVEREVKELWLKDEKVRKAVVGNAEKKYLLNQQKDVKKS